MNHRINFMAAVACVAVLAGCDWGGVDSDEAWNDAYSWLNFSGTYTLSNPGSVEAGEENMGDGQGFAIRKGHHEGKCGGDGITDTSGTIGEKGLGIVPGTFSLTIAYERGTRDVHDDGNGNLTSNVGSENGSISYGSGTWSYHLAQAASGVKWSANYDYKVLVGAAGSGASIDGGTITYFHVSQKGNLFTMTDSRGVKYSGRVTGASAPKTGFTNASDVRLAFEVAGDGGRKIVGHFRGRWSGAATGATGVLTDRIMTATYFNGRAHSDIQGSAAAISLKPKVVVASGSGEE